MTAFENNTGLPVGNPTFPRRKFMKSAVMGTMTGIPGMGLISACNGKYEEETGPAEILMREHGVLNRIMMIYDACRARLISGETFSAEALVNAAQIIRTFIEDYHEKLEEEFLFPRFVNADKLVGLNQLLYIQHATGRKLTDQILQLAGAGTMNNDEDAQKLVALLDSFNWMYRSHESREDTVLFPALRSILSGNEYYAIGEDFEKKEYEIMGKAGFETVLARVENIEKQMNIYDMTRLTPTLPI